LASDVDAGPDDQDLEALYSDGEGEVDEELGIDVDETICMLSMNCISLLIFDGIL
jgi:hypothetical protein